MSDLNNLLIAASERSNTRNIKSQLEAGADPNCRNECGSTPLHMAARTKTAGCIEVLLEAGADPNIPDINGNTALHEAAERGLVGLMRRLVLFGADIYAVNVKKKNPLDLLKNSFPKKYSRSAEPLQRLAEKIRSKHLNKEDRAGSSVTGYEFDI